MHSEIELIYLCNTTAEVAGFRSFGLPAIFCNHNAFVDENLFHVADIGDSEAEAVYNAALVPYKRLELANKVRKLSLISYREDGHLEYEKFVFNLLLNARWLNQSSKGEFRWLNTPCVANHLSSSSVGLCLSRREGAMYASIEYLLSGLSVVSTPSSGGRDVFFCKNTASIVADDSNEIARAVHLASSRSNVDRQAIRKITLSRTAEHRARYNALVEKLILSEGSLVRSRDSRFVGHYRNKLFVWRTALQIYRLVRLK